jgi:hypothetical protein
MKRHEERLAKWTLLAGPIYTLADVNTSSMTAAKPYFFRILLMKRPRPARSNGCGG